jgi:hypothetical protein
MEDKGSNRALREIKEDLDHLYKTIYQGNGAPALTSQVSKLEQRLNALEQKLDANFKSIDTEISLKFKNISDVVAEKFNYISYQISHEFQRRNTDSTGRWTFRTGMITTGIAGISSLLAIIIAELIKRL